MLTLGLVVLRVEPDERAALDVEPGRAGRVGAVHAVEREVHAIGRFERCRRERAAVDLDRAELRLDDRAAAVVGAAVDRQRRAFAHVERVDAAAAFSLVGAVDAARRRVDHRVGVNIERRPVAGRLELARNRHRVRAEVDRDRNRDDRAVSRCRLRHIRREVRKDVDHVVCNSRVDRVLQRRVVRTTRDLHHSRGGGRESAGVGADGDVARGREARGAARDDIRAVVRPGDRDGRTGLNRPGAIAVVRRDALGGRHRRGRTRNRRNRDRHDVQHGGRGNGEVVIRREHIGRSLLRAIDRERRPVVLVRRDRDRELSTGDELLSVLDASHRDIHISRDSRRLLRRNGVNLGRRTGGRNIAVRDRGDGRSNERAVGIGQGNCRVRKDDAVGSGPGLAGRDCGAAHEDDLASNRRFRLGRSDGNAGCHHRERTSVFGDVLQEEISVFIAAACAVCGERERTRAGQLVERVREGRGERAELNITGEVDRRKHLRIGKPCRAGNAGDAYRRTRHAEVVEIESVVAVGGDLRQ